MGKIDYRHFDKDLAYINGLEAGVNLVKSLFELSTDKRMTLFDDVMVSNILDKYNFAEIIEILNQLNKVETPFPERE